jgi:hypothetical protein
MLPYDLPERIMQPSLLEELTPVPNPYPIVAEEAYPDVWRLCEQARELAWDPAKIDFSDVEKADIPREVRAAGAVWWSLRAWMEHGATPYGAERLRDAIFGHQPFEVKQHIANFIMEELRHHEASFHIARAIGAGAPITSRRRAPTTSSRSSHASTTRGTNAQCRSSPASR